MTQSHESTPSEPVPPKGTPIRGQDEIERLYRDHNTALLRFVTAKLGSEQEAQEVAQEAYVRLLRLDRPGEISYLEALLFKTAANLALDRIRARTRQLQMQHIDCHDSELFGPFPERIIEGHQAVDVVRQALGELPEKCRLALLMSRLQGLNQTEIATRLGLHERMIRNHITRALEHLRLRLDQAEGRVARKVQRIVR